MTFARRWLRMEIARRWRSLTVLALLVAFSLGTVLTAVAGARRGHSALDRLLAQTSPVHVLVLPNQPGFDWEPVRALPEVESLATFPVADLAIDGAEGDGISWPYSAEFQHEMERPVVFEGRIPDPARADEMWITPEYERAVGKGVGDTVTIQLFSPEEADLLAEGEEPERTGPRIEARIVGMGLSPWASDPIGGPGGIMPSPGLFTQYRANLVGAQEKGYVNAIVRLRGGTADVGAFQAGLARVSGRTDIEVANQADTQRQMQDVNSFESGCLLAFGLAALAAAVVLVGQAVARYAGATAAGLRSLRAAGLTPRQAGLAATLGPSLAAAVGASLGFAGAVVASRWMPIGAPRLSEPDPGTQVDALVLTTGWALAVLLVIGGAAAAARAALSARSRTATRRSTVALVAGRAGLPVPMVIGTRFAFEPGRGRSAVPVRPALLGSVIGVGGVLAAFMFSAGVSDAAANPARFGQTQDFDGFFGYSGQDFAPSRPVLEAVSRLPEVGGVNDARTAVGVSGEVSVSLYSLDPIGAGVPVVLTKGRLPGADDEVVLAPTSARNLGARVGSALTFVGDGAPQALTVTGVGFVPNGPHNDHASGGWLTRGAYDRLFTGFKFHLAHIVLQPGVDAPAALEAVNRAASAVLGAEGVQFGPRFPSTSAEQVRDVRALPVALGAFLSVLAVGAVGHVLATAVRRRRHDVAVMRALGLTRCQARVVVMTQATLLALVGLAFGVPLGFVVGRGVWQQVAESTPMAYHQPIATTALLLIAPVTLLAANLLAALPGRRAARLQVAQTLRAE